MNLADAPDLAGTRVAVTGGAGFIGSHAVRALLASGADVTVVAPDPARRPPPPPQDGSGQARTRELDPLAPSTSTSELQQALSGAQAVVHLAYRPPPGGTTDARQHELTYNVGGLTRLLDSLPSSVRHVAFASSVMVYGPDVETPVSEDHEARPTTPYGRAKLTAERLLRARAEEAGILPTILRFATVYGPGETVPRAVPNFIRATLAGRAPTVNGNGDDVRDYVHVSDVARGIVQALTRDESAPDTFNVASGIGRSTREVAELVVRLAGGREAPTYVPSDAPVGRLVCDVTRAREAFGYVPDVDLADGVRDELAWFQRHPSLWDEDRSDGTPAAVPGRGRPAPLPATDHG